MKRSLVPRLLFFACLLTISVASAEVEIILDNPTAQMVGTWTTGTATTTRYGADYYYCTQSPTGTNSATYMPGIPTSSSDWGAYTWYPAGSNRPTQAQYLIHTAFTDQAVYVNQQINGQQWFPIGTYAMNAGSGNYVKITNVGSETTKVVMADAVRFHSPTVSVVPDTSPPVISEVLASPAPTSAVITWTTDEPATTQVEYGETESYGIQTAETTALVVSHRVDLTGLSLPQTYHFRVKSRDLYGNQAVSGDYTFTTSSEIPQVPQFRAAWCTGWDVGFRSAAQVTAMVDTLWQANYNVLIPEVRTNGDAYYDSAYENRALSITDPPPFDPLADMLVKGHAKGMEVHAWLVTYRITDSTMANAPPVFYEHQDWLTKDTSGNLLNNNFYLLDQGVPGVQDYVCKVVLDIAKYDVDGINFDYIRYQGGTWGYNEITRQRFYDEYGYWPPTLSSDPNWGTWCDYRRRQVTDLVKKCYLEVMAIRPNVKMTADTSTGGSAADFTTSAAYTSVFQDWRKWMQDHILDASIPMNYRDESIPASAQAYRDWAQFTIDNRFGRHAYIGMSPYKNSIPDSIGQMYTALDMGADGVSTFSYTATNKDGLPDSEFYNAVEENLYTSPVPTPDMPWKTAPTTGIIFGTVTDAAEPNDPIYANWVYKATVTATGPVARTTQTDATGTYGFIDLPAGTYSISASKTGFPTRTYTGQTIAAGQVLREDFDLGTMTISSPSGTVGAGWNIISLPLEPVDTNPETVFAGIAIDGNLYRWDNPSRSYKAYDSWSPGTFGDCNTRDGYYLYSAGPATISYSALGGTPAQHDIPIPIAGWAIIGCPYLSDRWWADTQVTHSGSTVSMNTAAKTNGWLDSVGWWWDNSSQSLRSLGLPDDFPASEYLQPWHGYWSRRSRAA